VSIEDLNIVKFKELIKEKLEKALEFTPEEIDTGK